MWCGMLGMRLWQYSTYISFIQAFFIVSTKVLAQIGCLSETFLFRIFNTFSTRLRQDSFWATIALRPLPSLDNSLLFCTIVHEYRGSIKVQAISKLFSEQFHTRFTIHSVPVIRKYSPVVTELHITPKIIWLGGWVLLCGCCIFFIFYFYLFIHWRPSHMLTTYHKLLY